MLKKIRGLFLGLVVLAGSACVTPTHASSASPESLVAMTYIQAGGTGGAKDELVVIYNQSDEPIDISDWCLVNKSAVAFACFASSQTAGVYTQTILPGRTFATIASNEHTAGVEYETPISLEYTVTNQSSGSIVSSADVMSVVNQDSEVVDSKAWSSTAGSGKALGRKADPLFPELFLLTGLSDDWKVMDITPAPQSNTQVITTIQEVDKEPEEPEGETGSEPGDSEGPDNTDETEQVNNNVEDLRRLLLITEVLPNPDGADTGAEYIELFNPTTGPVQLNGLRLRVGLETPKWFSLPVELEIAPGSYIALYNSLPGFGFTLVNTSGAVQLYIGDEAISDRILYESPKSGESWALIDGTWQYTDVVTPNAQNILYSVEGVLAAEAESNSLKPCAPNQYRSPETNRCRLITTATSTLVACKAGQYRSSETNRCRSIASDAKTLTPCKEGQERNTETNRCRNIVQMTAAAYAPSEVQETAGTQLAWYYWVAIAGVIALLMGYAIWEWRAELFSAWSKVKSAWFANRRK